MKLKALKTTQRGTHQHHQLLCDDGHWRTPLEVYKISEKEEIDFSELRRPWKNRAVRLVHNYGPMVVGRYPGDGLRGE